MSSHRTRSGKIFKMEQPNIVREVRELVDECVIESMSDVEVNNMFGSETERTDEVNYGSRSEESVYRSRPDNRDEMIIKILRDLRKEMSDKFENQIGALASSQSQMSNDLRKEMSNQIGTLSSNLEKKIENQSERFENQMVTLSVSQTQRLEQFETKIGDKLEILNTQMSDLSEGQESLKSEFRNLKQDTDLSLVVFREQLLDNVKEITQIKHQLEVGQDEVSHIHNEIMEIHETLTNVRNNVRVEITMLGEEVKKGIDKTFSGQIANTANTLNDKLVSLETEVTGKNQDLLQTLDDQKECSSRLEAKIEKLSGEMRKIMSIQSTKSKENITLEHGPVSIDGYDIEKTNHSITVEPIMNIPLSAPTLIHHPAKY